MRAYIVIVALAVVAMSACIYTASPQVRLSTGLNCTVDCSGYDAGYKWAEQHGIDDEDYCPYGDKSFHEGCVAYLGPSGAAFTTDNGMGVPPPLNPDDDDDNN